MGTRRILHRQPDGDPGRAVSAGHTGNPLLRPRGVVRHLDRTAGVVGIRQRQAQQGAACTDLADPVDDVRRGDDISSVHGLDTRRHRPAGALCLGDGAVLLGAGGRSWPGSPGASDDAAARVQRRQRLCRRHAGVRSEPLDAARDVAPGDRIAVRARRRDLPGTERAHRPPAWAVRQSRCRRRSRHVCGAARARLRDQRVDALEARRRARCVICRSRRDLPQSGPRVAGGARRSCSRPTPVC